MTPPRTGAGAATAGGSTGDAEGAFVAGFAGDGAADAGGATGDSVGAFVAGVSGDGTADAGGATAGATGLVTADLAPIFPYSVVDKMFAYSADILLQDKGDDYFTVIPLFPSLNNLVTIDSAAKTIVVTATTSSRRDIDAGRATWAALYTDSGVQTVPNSKTGIRIKHAEGDGNVPITLSVDLERPVRS